MATTITSECINCGACEPECPNTAIYGGGVSWELNGETHPAIAQDIYYIVPEKCTECVGFYDHEACAAVCPVDCCIPDPTNLESEAVLIERAKVLHPEQTFGADFPSRFRKERRCAAAMATAADGARPASRRSGAAAAAGLRDAEPGEAGWPGRSGCAAPKPAAAPHPLPRAAQSDEFDPIAWEVPVRCKDCNEIYAIPYRHFQVGVVFYCPICSGSFVPNSRHLPDRQGHLRGLLSGRRQREREALGASARASRSSSRPSRRPRWRRSRSGLKRLGGRDQAGGQDGAAQGPRLDVHLSAIFFYRPARRRPYFRALASLTVGVRPARRPIRYRWRLIDARAERIAFRGLRRAHRPRSRSGRIGRCDNRDRAGRSAPRGA